MGEKGSWNWRILKGKIGTFGKGINWARKGNRIEKFWKITRDKIG